jgi:hypothetical protein
MYFLTIIRLLHRVECVPIEVSIAQNIPANSTVMDH